MNKLPAERKTMRDVFIERLSERMESDDRIHFLTADFGAPKLDLLRQRFRQRFINVGIAEQNLINVATGLALEGCVVYAYAIAPFLTMRAYEPIRNNLALLSQASKLNVNLVGVGAGLSYDVSGPTHHCLEDISIMRTLPNIEVFSPSDWKLAEAYVDHSIDDMRPKYLRFDGKPLPALYDSVDSSWFKDGFNQLRSGDKVCIVATGYMVQQALRIAETMRSQKVAVGVVDVFLLKGLNAPLLAKSLGQYQSVISLEEAFIKKAGLDCLVLNLLNEYGLKPSFKALGFADNYIFEVGTRDYLHKMAKLDDDSIIKTIKEIL